MNALNFKDVTKIFLGTGSSRVAVQSVHVGSNRVWPALPKPVISETYINYIQDPVPARTGFYVSFIWNAVQGATEYWIYINDTKVAELQASPGQNSDEVGVFSYGSTVKVQVEAHGTSAVRMSDPVYISVQYPTYSGNTYSFDIVPSKTNLFGWTSGDDVKLYACFTSWPSSSQLQDFQNVYGADIPFVQLYGTMELTASGVATQKNFDYGVMPMSMDPVDVYYGYVTPLGSNQTVYYSQIILLDDNFADSITDDFTLYTPVAPMFSSWVLNGSKYRLFPTNGIGGEESQM